MPARNDISKCTHNQSKIIKKEMCCPLHNLWFGIYQKKNKILLCIVNWEEANEEEGGKHTHEN